MSRLAIPCVWNPQQHLHRPNGEVWVGVRTPGTEVPGRADAIREALAAAGADWVDSEPHVDDELLEVCDRELLDHLESAWGRWTDAGLDVDPGQDRVVPYLFSHPGLIAGVSARMPVAASARAGWFAYDTMTLIGPGSYEAIRGSADAALTAADMVAGGAEAAYACCRPPGHHATRRAYGGSCYLNNAAAAAARLRARLEAPVAVIDVDAHHGNGTQSIFYSDPEVATGSVHVDPGAGWFPHLVGFSAETGAGSGEGANLNLPLAPGTGDDGWLAAVERLRDWAIGRNPRAIVVALGVDAAAGDPESPLRVSVGGYERAGAVIARASLPTVVVQEGGYDLATIGDLVGAFLSGLERG